MLSGKIQYSSRYVYFNIDATMATEFWQPYLPFFYVKTSYFNYTFHLIQFAVLFYLIFFI